MADPKQAIDWGKLLQDFAALIALLSSLLHPAMTKDQKKAALKGAGCPDHLCDCCCQCAEAAQLSMQSAQLSLQCCQNCCQTP